MFHNVSSKKKKIIVIADFLPLRRHRSVAFNNAAVSIKSWRRDGLHESFVTSGEALWIHTWLWPVAEGKV